MRSRKKATTLGLLAAVVLTFPASAEALTVSVTGDDGVPQALNGQSIRNMAPQIVVGDVGTTSYIATVSAPHGESALATGCSSATDPRTVVYRGNGTYTLTITVFSGPGCTGTAGTPASFTFAIQAGVTLAPDPNSPLLTREPDEFATLEHRLPITGNPGADAYDVRYSTNAALRASGALVGPTRSAFVDAATSTVPLRFTKPGSYTVVARARILGGAATPWTAPLTLRVYAPFDFASSSFPDSRGPIYALRVTLRERTARGSVRISVSKGWTGRTHYHSIGSARIVKGGFTKRFRLASTGDYRIRYRFNGSGTTAPGTVVEKVRIRRAAARGA